MKTVSNNSIWLPALFDNLFLENKLDGFNNYETFSIPTVNVIESLTDFIVQIAAPGLEKKDFSIEVEEETLKIFSKKTSKKEGKEEKEESRFIKREFNYESFERSFKLPENIQIDDIQANYENGVLSVTLPKMEEKKALKKMVEIS